MKPPSIAGAGSVPLRWPHAWNETTLNLLDGTPINCLVFDNVETLEGIGEIGKRQGRTGLIWAAASESGVEAGALVALRWDTPLPVLAIRDGLWPGVRLNTKGNRDEAEAGPTGAPWIDSNAWALRLATARAPGKTVWLSSDPPSGDVITEQTYMLAIAEAFVFGARWLISLDSRLSASLAAGDRAAVDHWGKITSTLHFFETHRTWQTYQPVASLAVISGFSDTNELVGEILNLAGRRNLLYRIIESSRVAAEDLRDLKAVLYADREPPQGSLRELLDAFVREGGLLIAQASAVKLPAGAAMGPGPVPGYDVRPVGKGRIATCKSWDDPYTVAVDTQILIGRRHDCLRLFNAGSIAAYFSSVRGGKAALVQLVNYTTRPAVNPVTVAFPKVWGSARLWSLEQPSPSELKPINRQNGIELHLPTFSVYAAVELEMT